MGGSTTNFSPCVVITAVGGSTTNFSPCVVITGEVKSSLAEIRNLLGVNTDRLQPYIQTNEAIQTHTVFTISNLFNTGSRPSVCARAVDSLVLY